MRKTKAEEGLEALVSVKILGEFPLCPSRHGTCKKVGNYSKIHTKIRLRDGCRCVTILVLSNSSDNPSKSNAEAVNSMRLKIDTLRSTKSFYHPWLLVNPRCKPHSVNRIASFRFITQRGLCANQNQNHHSVSCRFVATRLCF